jgi:hypothetical protein
MHGWTRVRSLSRVRSLPRALPSEDSDTDAHTCTHTYGACNLPLLRNSLSLSLPPPASPYLSPSAAATAAEIFESRTLGRERGTGGEEGEGRQSGGGEFREVLGDERLGVRRW